MPEGDTIHRAATRLARALAGKTIARFETTVPALARAHLDGRAIDAVEARGKHLAIRFDDGRVLLTHMRMHGSWHLYRPNERWQRPAHEARVTLEVLPANGDERLVAVCFAAPVVRLVDERVGDRDLARLGPDVVSEGFDPREAGARLRAMGGERAIGEAILDQRVIAGVGNIYKSEVLFAESIDPRAGVCDLDDRALEAIALRAHTLMRRNVAAGRAMRTTTAGLAGGAFAVYRRSGRPCPRCGEPVARIVQGSDRRSTYFCPGCQRRV